MRLKTYYTATDGSIFIPDTMPTGVTFCNSNQDAYSQCAEHEKMTNDEV